MKSTLPGIWLIAAFAFGAGTAQAASFTYHGSLQDSGKPAEGSYDIELTLYSAPSGGSVIGGPLVMYKVPVHGGSFNTEADFGPLSQSFSQAFVGVRVRSAGKGDYAALNGRSQVTAATAVSVCPGAWTLNGNAGNPAGSYLGTADTQPLTLLTWLQHRWARSHRRVTAPMLLLAPTSCLVRRLIPHRSLSVVPRLPVVAIRRQIVVVPATFHVQIPCRLTSQPSAEAVHMAMLHREAESIQRLPAVLTTRRADSLQRLPAAVPTRRAD